MSETNDTTNEHDATETRCKGIDETPFNRLRARIARKRVARFTHDPFISTGCPIADVVESGLRFDPQIGCGPARVEFGRLIWDPTQPLGRQLRELSEQAAIWRTCRGLRLVDAESEVNAPNTGASTKTVSTGRRPQLQLLNGGLYIRAQRPADNGDAVQ